MSKHGNFFAIDRRAWATVCDLGSINAAVSYLVIARGSLSDMRTTAWSVNAIEKHTGVPRHLAQIAVKKLLAAGIVRQTRGGTKPLYYLVAPHEFPTPKPEAMTGSEASLLRLIENAGRSTFVPKVAAWDSDWPNTKPYGLAVELVRKGHLTDDGGQFFGLAVGPDSVAEEPDWIWLTNAIVDGAVGEIPPAELLRQTQDVDTLRLFVDLYHAQSLARTGGLHWRHIREEFTRHKVGQSGAYTVWGFQRGTLRVWFGHPFAAPHVDKANQDEPAKAFWSRLATLRALGLIEHVAHVIEADTDEAAVMYPYGAGSGEPIECQIGVAAHSAGQALLTEGQVQWVAKHGLWLLPVPHHISGIQLVGLIRLRYRARTAATAEWQDGAGDWADVVERFREIAQKGEATQGFATSTEHQR